MKQLRTTLVKHGNNFQRLPSSMKLIRRDRPEFANNQVVSKYRMAFKTLDSSEGGGGWDQ